MTKENFDLCMKLNREIREEARRVLENYLPIYDKVSLEFDPDYVSNHPNYEFDNLQNGLNYIAEIYFRGSTDYEHLSLSLSLLYDFNPVEVENEIRKEKEDLKLKKALEKENERLRRELAELEHLRRLKEKYEQ